jgi:hypothetical protein
MDTIIRDIAALKARIEQLDAQMRPIMEPFFLDQLHRLEEIRDRRE